MLQHAFHFARRPYVKALCRKGFSASRSVSSFVKSSQAISPEQLNRNVQVMTGEGCGGVNVSKGRLELPSSHQNTGLSLRLDGKHSKTKRKSYVQDEEKKKWNSLSKDIEKSCGTFAMSSPSEAEMGAFIQEAEGDVPTSFIEPCFSPSDIAELFDQRHSALPIVIKRPDVPRLFHPTSSSGLLRKLIEITTIKPLPSLSRLLRFHDAYPLLHSTSTFNYLIQHAIRHTDYTTADKLFQKMTRSGLCHDIESRVLRIRLLVRSGKRSDALKLIRMDVLKGLEVSPELWIELLGYSRSTPSMKDKDEEELHEEPAGLQFEDNTKKGREKLQSSLFQACALIQDARVLDRFAFLAVQFLLRNSERQAAQLLTKQWLERVPSQLSNLRAERCLNVLHLHLAHSELGIKAHMSMRSYVKEFLRLCPSIKPNSSTLFLLLRSLKRSCTNATGVALMSLQAFKKKWGSSVVDRRVQRRMAAIALKEGNHKVARQWIEKEGIVAEGRETEDLVRQVTGAEQLLITAKDKKLPMRRFMLGESAEDTKWIWVRRRFNRTISARRRQSED